MEKLKPIDRAIDLQNYSRLYHAAAVRSMAEYGRLHSIIYYQLAAAVVAKEARDILINLIGGDVK